MRGDIRVALILGLFVGSLAALVRGWQVVVLAQGMSVCSPTTADTLSQASNTEELLCTGLFILGGMALTGSAQFARLGLGALTGLVAASTLFAFQAIIGFGMMLHNPTGCQEQTALFFLVGRKPFDTPIGVLAFNTCLVYPSLAFIGFHWRSLWRPRRSPWHRASPLDERKPFALTMMAM
jgi:hypothetical protein